MENVCLTSTVLSVFALGLIVSCSSVKVTNTSTLDSAPVPKPECRQMSLWLP